ncbi:hypothetical protein C8J57DRAFT_1335990 [Mycena rebaudengoi]|nr:hypothetical protein C8J57DRAFT_1335990 [Mycena rebaudengoi]
MALSSTTTNNGGATSRRRQRSPDAPTAAAGKGPTSNLITQSPTTARTLKKGRIDDPFTDPSATPHRTTGPASPSPNAIRSPSKQMQNPVEALDSSIDLLRKVIAGTEVWRGNAEFAAKVAEYAEELWRIARYFDPVENEAPTTPSPPVVAQATTTNPPADPAPAPAANRNQRASYSDAAKTAPTSVPRDRAQRTAPTTNVLNPKQHLPAHSTPRATSRHAPHRLILRFPSESAKKTLPAPEKLRTKIEKALKGISRLRGVNLTKAGNIVLHTQPPYTAAQLAEQEDKIWEVVRSYFALTEDERPLFHLDKPWHRVVIHSIPTMNLELGAELVASGDIPIEAIMDFRLMLRSEDVPPFISVLVCLSDAEVARRSIRDGVFIAGTHCRASRYDPTRGRRGR